MFFAVYIMRGSASCIEQCSGASERPTDFSGSGVGREEGLVSFLIGGGPGGSAPRRLSFLFSFDKLPSEQA